MDDFLYIYWLFSTPGITRRAASALYESRCLEELWSAPPNNSLLKRRDKGLLLSEIEALDKKGIWLLTYGGKGYPRSLAEIDDPPMLLYGKGMRLNDFLPRIAVIGARKCSPYGLSSAKKLSKGLTSAGFVIVSGMALGIDAQAHETAIETASAEMKGFSSPFVTVAVLGCGVEVCYPYENRDIYDRVQQYGCVVSEYPPHTRPAKYMFPERNRIITGLSMGVIVVEAAIKSGTSRTVDIALSQGREIFVVPGSISSPNSAGTNNLLKEGAKPITSHTDVINELIGDMGYGYMHIYGNETNAGEHNIKSRLLSVEYSIYRQLSAEPVGTDCLAAATGLESSDVMYILSKMELYGVVTSVQKGFIKAWGLPQI
jgi:DNA processing protein